MSKSSHTIDEIKEKWGNIKDKGSEFAHQMKEKSSDMAHNLETNPNTKEFWRYVKENKKEAVLGALMVLGLIFSFYWLGSLVVGIAAGLYAPWGLKGLWRKGQEFVREEGKFPAFVILVAAVFMLFHVFAFVIGFIAGLAVKSILKNEFSSDTSDQTRQ